MEKLNVLCVEDYRGLLEAWELYFENGEVNLIPAKTLSEVENKFEIHEKELSAIIMDAGRSLNTLPLLKRIREKFKGPIIAISSLYQDEQRKAGCDYWCEKEKVGSKLKEVLGLESIDELISNNSKDK